ncbi:MAG: hypothetical protein GYB64_05710, partial [Chloroflexi bacterium]|nr:hypothetical protein [Chloroflexota bacterium]
MPDRPIFNDLTSPDRSHGWRRVIFRFGIWQIIHRFWIRLRVEGWGNIPAEGPLIMMGNHVSA